MDPVDPVFRREAGRMLATLTRLFGVHNLALAEDVVQDALCRALEVWKFQGVPENPAAWLMAAAKHRALDVLRRERTARTFAPEIGRLIEGERALDPAVDELFGAAAIRDDQLRMMFSCCHPRLPEEAQIALVLHVLCGFGLSEIAGAFLATEAAIEKRISRAKKVLAGSSGCSSSRTTRSLPGSRRSAARSTSCSTRATTAPARRRPSGSSSAGRRCASPRSSSSTPPRRRPPRTRSLR
ncbi:hypothetical protein BE21_00545 [Sorangium cellulosum]|uniref:Sigma-70 family RNA polymerase sigma factor n=1 Tax=Sorangium cellulosum TaxID=56 RepID=A0A150TAG1_SORCE|nr:hypothetical protein BE21_00545 [Sorangium cellulosum]